MISLKFTNTQGLLEIPNEIWGTNAGEQMFNYGFDLKNTMIDGEIIGVVPKLHIKLDCVMDNKFFLTI